MDYRKLVAILTPVQRSTRHTPLALLTLVITQFCRRLAQLLPPPQPRHTSKDRRVKPLARRAFHLRIARDSSVCRRLPAIVFYFADYGSWAISGSTARLSSSAGARPNYHSNC